ncbi:uroporphyrinogen-III synthase [Bacillus coahuilensis]|uniref:uroporphyrinogen-III synthase n=1 Tax=Bacillus coahuilensis TaxID=408580 RepID=UPI000185083E|nr:uroporphyrinogen-III synthase [Bacillus coahuilensis]
MSSPSPLQDKQIIVTRGVEQSTSMIQAIECLGGTAHAVPLLAFSESTLEDEYLLMMEKITQFEWIFFTSHNSIHFFRRKLKKLGISLKDLHVNIAAVGEKTAKHLRELGVEVDFLPSRFTAEDMIQEFLLENPLAQHILIPKGNLASSILSNGLAKERISHQEWVIYKNEVPTSSPQCLEETVKNIGSIVLHSQALQLLRITSKS